MECALLPQVFGASFAVLPRIGQCGMHSRAVLPQFSTSSRDATTIQNLVVGKAVSTRALAEEGQRLDSHQGSSENERAKESSEEEDGVVTETLKLLEWFPMCEQVANYASTPMGRRICIEGCIPFGNTMEESEMLLEQTASACLLPSPLDFSGIIDLSAILRSASVGSVLSVSELCVVEETLSSSRHVYEQLHSCIPSTASMATFGHETRNDIMGRVVKSKELSLLKGHHAFYPLSSIMANTNFCMQFVEVLNLSLDKASLSILDTASPALATLRALRRENMKALETLLLEMGEKVVSAGGMDSVIITTRRARQCIAVRASHKHLLPGGVVLDFSNTGATVFMEPKAALELNNKEVELCSKVKTEELLILERLTRKLAAVACDIWILLENITLLDLACAKAGHARWLESVKPIFSLKSTAAAERKQSGEVFLETSNSLLVDIEGLSHPLLLGQALVSSEKLPVPVDFKVKFDVRAVIISGPNTGGKTASMKTLGLATLMAKAGLFIPASGKAVLPWFDKVLADIGDSQSLEQSLSTFSGHIQKTCQIMKCASSQSLVLFDELGSGTDPLEGAALASAILEHMANRVCLTIVTTHFSKLSSFRRGRFEVASVEFDAGTLRPKYKILWGFPGQSNALDIAGSLGVDEATLACARHWMRKLAPESQQQWTTQLMDPLMEQRKILKSQANATALVLSDAKSLHNELASEANGLETRLGALRIQREDRVKSNINAAKFSMREIVSIFEGSLNTSEKSMSMGEALGSIALVVELYLKTFGELEKEIGDLEVADRPSAGDSVLIKRLGKTPAKVIEAPTETDESFLVQLGGLKLRAKLSEVAKVLRNEKGQAGLQLLKRHGDSPSEGEEGQVGLQLNKTRGEDTPSNSLEARGAAIRTSRNTLDLRGMRVDEALMHLHFALIRSRRVLFVVHGEGTGALRAAVLEKLRGHPLVLKFEQESPMNYGCTVVYLK